MPRYTSLSVLSLIGIGLAEYRILRFCCEFDSQRFIHLSLQRSMSEVFESFRRLALQLLKHMLVEDSAAKKLRCVTHHAQRHVLPLLADRLPSGIDVHLHR